MAHFMPTGAYSAISRFALGIPQISLLGMRAPAVIWYNRSVGVGLGIVYN